LVIGEVRQEECLDLLIAMNSGMPSMCSLHANGARQALNKLCLLPMLAGNNVSSEFVIPTVASVVDLVVHTAMNPDGRRQVQEISVVTGRIEGSVVETTKIFDIVEGALCATGFYPESSSGLRDVGYDVRRELMRAS
jgi:pilus assembly protein CpaF